MNRLNEIGKRIFADMKQYGIAVILVFIYYLAVSFCFGAFCPMIIVSGLPCAGCGLTRALLFVLTGQFARAFYINPMIYPTTLFVIYCGYFRYIKGNKIKCFHFLLGTLIVVTLIFYCYRMYLYFPNRVPYVYARKNLLADSIPPLKQLMENIISNIVKLRLK